MNLRADKLPPPLSFDVIIDRCVALANRTDIRNPPRADDRWAMAPDALGFIDSFIRNRKPRTILEFGPGKSSRIIIDACRESTLDTQVISIEHDPDFFTICQQSFADTHLKYQCILAPLVSRQFAEYWLPAYSGLDSSLADHSPFDLIIVDGPPQSLGGREGVLYQLLEFTKSGTVIILDDANRQDVRDALKRWQENLGDAVHVRRSEGFLRGLACAEVRRRVTNADLADHRAQLTLREITELISGTHKFVLLDNAQLRPHEELAPWRIDQGRFFTPKDDSEAINLLKKFVASGATYIAVAWPLFWWFHHFPGFYTYVHRQLAPVMSNARIRVFRLRDS